MLWNYSFVVFLFWQSLLWILVDSSGCTPFQSITAETPCTGVLNTSLYIPCGLLNRNASTRTNFTYQLYPPNQPSTTIRTSEFLILRLQLNHNRMIIICFNDQNQKEAVYKLNVTYAPYSGHVAPRPIVSVGSSIAIICPITANPPPVYKWLRYNDIDQAKRIPLPDDLDLSKNNRTMSVQAWRGSMNGFYVCCGTNYLGQHCYVATTVMRLFSKRCNGVIKSNGHVSTPDNRRIFPLSSSIIIHCLIYYATLHQPPNWFFANETGINVLIPFLKTPPSYKIQYRNDSENCIWNSTLIISNFSLNTAGSYKCSYGQLVKQINIDLEVCDKLKRDNISLTVSPSNSVVSLRGTLLTLSCMVNGTPSDGVPFWCKVTPYGCNRLNLTSSISRNCSWINTIEINITDSTVGKYRCVIFDKIQQVEVNLQEGTLIDQITKTSPTVLVSSLVATIVFIIIIITSVSILLHWYKTTRYSRTFEPPYEGFKWDVFISYHSEAEDFANLRIKEALENKDYSVCWHHSDFVGGVTITDNINQAVDYSRKVIFVFTEHFTSSEYCMMELNRALDRLQSTRTRCMIPIALDEKAVPIELKSSVTYWPVVDAKEFCTEKLIELIGSPIRNITVHE